MASRKYRKSRRKIMKGCGGKRFRRKSRRRVGMKGGNLFKIPEALSGASWAPGVNSNHYSLNNYKSQIDYNTGSERTNMRGGAGSIFSALPNDLVNIGNVAAYSSGKISNGLIGVASPTNPLPWVQKL
jgi:hypothetical protein